MKNITFIAVLLAVVSACERSAMDTPQGGRPETVVVDASGYEKTTFKDGAIVLPDKLGILSGDIHPYFDGFDLLVSNSESNNTGTMTTDVNSLVYILAPSSPVPPGWHLVSNTSIQEPSLVCTYGTTTINLSIFSKYAIAGVPVQIPVLNGTFSASPIARHLEYGEKSEDGGIAAGEVQVKGDLIDVRLLKAKEKVFPQNDDYVFGSDAVAAVPGYNHYAVSHVEKPGVTSMRCGAMETPVVAFDVESVPGWTATGKKLVVGDITYRIFTKDEYVQGEWFDLPKPVGSANCPLVFGHKMTVADTPEFGDVQITRVGNLRSGTISNVCITVLPDGSLLSACTGGKDDSGLVMYRSTDHGDTWEKYGSFDSSVNLICNYTNLFVHRGSVYLMGVAEDRVGFRISRSDDNGQTWTVPEDESTGLLLEGTYHTAQVPCVVAGGRIWRACETYDNDDTSKKPFMISAPEDADLLNAASWTRTNQVEKTSYYIGTDRISSMIEGNAVADPDGNVVNLIRTNCAASSNYGTILHLTGTTTLSYDPAKDWIHMPGGGKKFTVRYDEASKLYWSLTNPHFAEPVKNKGIYSGGMSNSLKRNRLVLISSPDLKNWTEHRDILYDPDPFFHGFQYADWVVDGDDLAVVVRAAYPEYRGLPVRQHDANKMIFVKVKNFRNN